MYPEVMPSYGRVDIEFERGDGSYLYTKDGARYLDFATGIAVNVLGHSHPHLLKALTNQGAKLWHCSNLYRIPEQEKLARRLVENSFAQTVFFCNSGAEAVEAALKLVRKYQSQVGHPERYRIISFDGSFHGRTLATIAAAKNVAHISGFGPMPEGFDQVCFGDLRQLESSITGETAAIIVEPIQGEGGIRPSNVDFLKGLRDACNKFGLLLIFDEVQTGMGRTGHLFAYENFGVQPDVMTVAKALGGGFPVGACLATEKSASGITPGTHGSTFGGNPLAMAVANAVLDILLTKGFLVQSRAMADFFFDKIRQFCKKNPKAFEDVRGFGLMIGLKCIPPLGDFVLACRNSGLLTVPAGDNVMRLLPPLNVDESQIGEALEMLEDAWGTLQNDRT